MAAVLACGDDASASHRTSSWLLSLRGAPSGPIDVTVLRGGGRRHAGLAVHVTRSLPDSERTSVKGIPCTTWARTLVDLAGVVTERQLQRALERTVELRVFDRDAMHAALANSRGKRGTGRLRRLLAHLLDEAPPTSSELERRFLDLVRTASLPHPTVNGHIGELQVDFNWPDHKLVVETDGRATHGHAIAFHRDRNRDLYLQERGWRVIRLSWRQVVDEPQRVAAMLGRLLAELGFGRPSLGGGALP
jgi:very-short-patch-repair endonuclease